MKHLIEKSVENIHSDSVHEIASTHVARRMPEVVKELTTNGKVEVNIRYSVISSRTAELQLSSECELGDWNKFDISPGRMLTLKHQGVEEIIAAPSDTSLRVWMEVMNSKIGKTWKRISSVVGASADDNGRVTPAKVVIKTYDGILESDTNKIYNFMEITEEPVDAYIVKENHLPLPPSAYEWGSNGTIRVLKTIQTDAVVTIDIHKISGMLLQVDADGDELPSKGIGKLANGTPVEGKESVWYFKGMQAIPEMGPFVYINGVIQDSYDLKDNWFGLELYIPGTDEEDVVQILLTSVAGDIITLTRKDIVGMGFVTLDQINVDVMDPGTVFLWAGTTPPDGALELDGSPVGVKAYGPLTSVLQYAAGGVGDTMYLPDMRGAVPIGWDHGRGYDSGRAILSEDVVEIERYNAVTQLPKDDLHTVALMFCIKY